MTRPRSPALVAATLGVAALGVALQAGMPARVTALHVLWLAIAGYGALRLLGGQEQAREDARAGRAAGTSRLATLLRLAGVLELAAWIRTFDLGQASIWLDEGISLWHAHHSWAELLPRLASHDESPPLYFALLRLWLVLGESEATIRLLSVLCSLAAVLLADLLGRELAGPRAGFLAGLFVAVSAVQLHYAQEARMYSLVAALTLGSLLGGLRLWRAAPRAARRWAIGWGALLAALCATHQTAALVAGSEVVALGAAALWQRRRRGVVAAGVLVAALLWAPLLPLLVQQSRLVYGRYWIPAPDAGLVRGTILDSSVGGPPPPPHIRVDESLAVTTLHDLLPRLLALPRIEPLRRVSLGFTRVADVLPFYAGAAAVVGLAAVRRRRGVPATLLAGAVVVLPFLLLLAVSQVRPLLLARTVIGGGTVALVLLAAACAALPALPRALLATAFVFYQLLGLGEHWWYPPTEDFRGAAAQIASRAQPGDLALIDGRWAQLPLDFYLERTPAGAAVERRGVPLTLEQRGKPEPVITAADAPAIRALAAGRSRLWLVLSHSADTDPDNVVRSTLDREFPCFDVWSFPGVRVQLFTRC